jgi:hypothetical protein
VLHDDDLVEVLVDRILDGGRLQEGLHGANREGVSRAQAAEKDVAEPRTLTFSPWS